MSEKLPRDPKVNLPDCQTEEDRVNAAWRFIDGCPGASMSGPQLPNLTTEAVAVERMPGMLPAVLLYHSETC